MARFRSHEAVGVLFLAAGAMHFIAPAAYATVIPPRFPSPKLLVALSGACEIAGGIGAFVPATRRYAGFGLIALLIAVFPANVYMALDTAKFGRTAPPIVWYARLPLQALLIAWVWSACCRRGQCDDSRDLH